MSRNHSKKPSPDIRRYTLIYARYTPDIRHMCAYISVCLAYIRCVFWLLGVYQRISGVYRTRFLLQRGPASYTPIYVQTQLYTTCCASGSMYTASTRIMCPVGRCTVRVVCAQTRALTLGHGAQSKKNWGSKAAAMPIRAGAAMRLNSNSELQGAGVQKLHVSTISCLKS